MTQSRGACANRRNSQYAVCVSWCIGAWIFANPLTVPPIDFLYRFIHRPPPFLSTMANETRSPSEVVAEVTKTTDHQVYKIHNFDDFSRITKGIKVARCMQSSSSYGEPHTMKSENHDRDPRLRLFIFRRSKSVPERRQTFELGAGVERDGSRTWHLTRHEGHRADLYFFPNEQLRLSECQISMLLQIGSKAWMLSEGNWCAYRNAHTKECIL